MTYNHIILRPVEAADLPLFFIHEQDEEAIQMAAFTPDDPANREAFMDHWNRLLANDTIIKRTIIRQDEVVGHIASWIQDGDREITYWIDRNHWGQGVATKSVELFRDEVTTRPLFARAAKDNVGSIRVLEKNGFVVTAEERGYANARGEEIDEVVMELKSP